MAAGIAAATPAATMFHGGSSVALANGSLAPAWTTPTITANRNQTGRPRIVAMSTGAPAVDAKPPTRAMPAAAIAGATIGTTARLTSGEMIASRPNTRRTTGSVAACAASDTARHSTGQSGSRAGARRRRSALSGVAQARMPAVANVDSWKPASLTSAGSTSSRMTAAHPRAAVARPARPLSRATRTTPAIAAALTTDGDAPANR